MVNVHPLSQTKAIAESLVVQQIFPQEKFVVPITDIEKWFSGVYCIHPERGTHCDVLRVKWVGRGGDGSYVSIRKYRNRLYLTTLSGDVFTTIDQN